MKKIALIITCEHAVNSVPTAYKPLFSKFQALLNAHNGIDFGALEIAEYLHSTIPSALVRATATRLLIDCNRSINHPSCFSEITRRLSPSEKQKIMDQYYLPFREQVIELIQHHIGQGDLVLHLSIHSFTPLMNGIVRNADIGLLYDPKRHLEKSIAHRWRAEINTIHPQYKLRMNYPYKGISDGFVSFLRKHHSGQEYIGIEVESNQKLSKNKKNRDILSDVLARGLAKIQEDMLL